MRFVVELDLDQPSAFGSVAGMQRLAPYVPFSMLSQST